MKKWILLMCFLVWIFVFGFFDGQGFTNETRNYGSLLLFNIGIVIVFLY
ncbi:hypothetical protein ADIARSV_2688 [Arcticibacter svalbardensis MN12-7]|uniref:Uncharacterized protein n=1 Tax=Arcticibacter svalbardensis MN12-7 TaxID=1150600 RepID=R9GRA6_9SPHI|nr:hypothetical protein ADIARSV_2688 [Arcticibacter svalbardensis MN12-7]